MKNRARPAILIAAILLLISACKDEEEFNTLFHGYWEYKLKPQGSPTVTLQLQHKGNEVNGTMELAPCNCCVLDKKYNFSGTVNSFNVLNWEAIIDGGGTASGTFKQTTDQYIYELVMLYDCDSQPTTFNYTMEKAH